MQTKINKAISNSILELQQHEVGIVAAFIDKLLTRTTHTLFVKEAMMEVLDDIYKLDQDIIFDFLITLKTNLFIQGVTVADLYGLYRSTDDMFTSPHLDSNLVKLLKRADADLLATMIILLRMHAVLIADKL